jgi:hypothetical protein
MLYQHNLGLLGKAQAVLAQQSPKASAQQRLEAQNNVDMYAHIVREIDKLIRRK